MKRFLIFTIFFLFFLVPTKVEARCTNAWIDPSQGTTSEIYYLYATGCESGLYRIRIYDGVTGGYDYDDPRELDVESELVLSISGLPKEGTYVVEVQDAAFDVFYEGYINVLESATLACGDSAPPNSTDCPTECPATWICNSIWTCGETECPTPEEAPEAPEGTGIDDKPMDMSFCAQAGNLKGKCEGCEGVWTAIGCIPTDPSKMIGAFIQVGIGIGGGISMITFIVAGFIYTMSKGDPQKATQAKEMMTSAVIGLLFVIFSITILRFIAVDLIQIPGFGI